MSKRMEVTQKTIGENTFYLTPFAAFTAANLSGELATIIAPIIGSFAPLVGNKNGGTLGEITTESVMDINIDDALPAFTKAVAGLSGDRFEWLMKKLLVNYNNVSVCGPATDGVAMRMNLDLANEVFCGDVEDMFLLCWEVIKLNYSGFFKKLGARFGNLQEAIQTGTPTTQNGESST